MLVTKPYEFEGSQGRATLRDLFAGRGQLLVYHFMFGPDWARAAPAVPSGPTASTASPSTWLTGT